MQTRLHQVTRTLYCHAAGCLAHVRSGTFMCRRHSAMLPEELSEAMRAGVRSRLRHSAAVCAAILYVAELEGRPTVALRRCLARWTELAEKDERAH